MHLSSPGFGRDSLFPSALGHVEAIFDLKETLGIEYLKAASIEAWRAWNTSDFTSIT
jgi:hypothetical protein